jgi:hypothetical protein
MSYPPAPRTYQIDVIDQVGRAYGAVFGRAQLVGEMALLPYLIVLAIGFVALLFSGGGYAGHALAALIGAVGHLVFGSVFLVRWHRFLLLGEAVSGGLIPPGYGDFMIAAIKLFAIGIAAIILVTVIGLLPPHVLTGLLSLIGGIAIGFTMLRVALIFPAAAIGRPIALRTAWDLMAGNYWRLFAGAFACVLPFAVLQTAIYAIAAAFPSMLWIVFEAARLAVSFAGLAVLYAMLSHLYRDIAWDREPA